MAVSRKQILAALETRHNPKVFFNQQDVPEKVIRQIPELWWELMAQVEVPIKVLYQVWEPAAGKGGPILQRMETKLQAVALLLEDQFPPSLLYVFRFKSGRLSFFRGNRPVEENELTKTQAGYRSKLPDEFVDFYQVHDGWVELFSLSGGPKPVADWEMFSRKKYDIDAKIDAGYTLDDVLVVSGSGSGDYLGYLIAEHSEPEDAVPLYIPTHDVADTERLDSIWDKINEQVNHTMDEYDTADDE